MNDGIYNFLNKNQLKKPFLKNGIWIVSCIFLYLILSFQRNDGNFKWKNESSISMLEFSFLLFFWLKWPFPCCCPTLFPHFLLLTLFNFRKSTFQLQQHDFSAWIFYGHMSILYNWCFPSFHSIVIHRYEIMHDRKPAKKATKF